MKFNLLFATLILAVSCASPSGDVTEQSSSAEGMSVKPNNQHSLNAVLYHQTAGEYKALCYQTYNLAKLQLNHKLQQHAFPYEKSPAIIMDLDETVIDNSFYNAQLIVDSANYTKDSWKNWSDLASAQEVPGAIDFIKYAQEKGVHVYFISNRYTNELNATIKNLEKLGLSKLDTAQFLLRVDEGSKDTRRKFVRQNHEVLMLFGDNLADFITAFDKQGTAHRNEMVDSLHQQFGVDFIVLPNVLYGEWEASLTNYDYSLSPAQKDEIKKAYLRGFSKN